MGRIINNLPRKGGLEPTGTINITANGTHDVTDYAEANVNVQSPYLPVYYPGAGTIVTFSGNAKTPKDQVDDLFQWLYIAPDFGNQAMNELTVVFCNKNDTTQQFKLVSGIDQGQGSGICRVQIQTADGVVIYTVDIPAGNYWKLPYFWTGNDACKIVSITKGLWYNNKHYLTSAY